MTKNKVIQRLIQSHNELDDVIQKISHEDCENVAINENNWTVKHVLSHLIAWNNQFIYDIQNILDNSYTDVDAETFNKSAIEEKLHSPYVEVYNEWKISLQNVIKRILSLTENQWNYSGTYKNSNRKISITSLFEYTYQGKSHESGHAHEIMKFFKITL